MRIALDISITNVNQAGTGIYTSSLVRALLDDPGDDDYVLLQSGQTFSMDRQKSPMTRLQTIYRDLFWTHVALPVNAALRKVDILHMPANVVPLISACPTVVTILDCAPLLDPSRFTPWHRTYSRLFLPATARQADRIMTISEHSKQDIVRLLHVPPEKISVTYPAASPAFKQLPISARAAVREKYDLGRYLFTVGTLEPRKNIDRIIRAFASLRRQGLPHLLVHAGPKGWYFDHIFQEAQKLQVEDAVRFLGRVPLEDLVGLYNAADVFLYPSEYEGFGLPILESMACACPVVTSNVSSLPEVAGDAAILVDPHSTEEIADAIQCLLEDRSLADMKRVSGIVRASQFSWQRCAAETREVYHSMMVEN